MTDTIHSCSPFCTLPGCVAGRQNQVTLLVEELQEGALARPHDVEARSLMSAAHATITAQAARIAELERENAELCERESAWKNLAKAHSDGAKLDTEIAAMQQGERNVPNT